MFDLTFIYIYREREIDIFIRIYIYCILRDRYILYIYLFWWVEIFIGFRWVGILIGAGFLPSTKFHR